MSKLTFTKAFADYGATLVNRVWAYSAIAKDGSLVFSCWEFFLRRQPDGSYRYEDRLSRWQRARLGKELFRKHLKQAFENKLPVRCVFASPKDAADIPNIIAGKEGAGKTAKTFSLRKDLVGRVTEFNGDTFAIDYRREGTS